MLLKRRAASLLFLAACAIFCGCLAGERKLTYIGDEELSHYKETATQIDYPHVHEPTAQEVQFAERPRTLLDNRKDEIWDLTLMEAIHIALSNNAIIRSRAAFLSSGNGILSNPSQTPSVFDPAIQETGVLFGSRGIESALAAFDATFTTTMTWGRNEAALNNLFATGGVPTLVQETGNFTSQLSKQFAYGGALSLDHNWNYAGNNAAGNRFASAYNGVLQAQYRHPLLAGAGAEYTRIAGPIAQSFGGLTGVTQGVTIARINNDITVADFEANVRNLLKDVEDLYWDLYLSYRVYDTAVTARNSALRTWREAELKRQVGGIRNFQIEDEAQARDRYFETQAQSEITLAAIYSNESQLRRLLALPVNDGRIIRPADEPVVAKFIPDWYTCLTESLIHRVELRKHKWNIKSLELQLKAANSLAQPRLDFISGYRVNAFGDRLLTTQNSRPFRSAYGSLTDGNHTGWDLGFEFTVPIGLRSAHAQVNNVELRLAKARAVLAAQEIEISHELANAFQQLAQQYVTADSNFNRRRAAQRRVQLYEKKVAAGTQTLDLLLRAQASLADAEFGYYSSLIAYNQAIVNIHYRKGTLLEHNNIYLAEGGWTPDAYKDALRKAWARTFAFDNELLHTEPEVLTYPGYVGEVQGIAPPNRTLEPTADDVPGDAAEPTGKLVPDAEEGLQVPVPAPGAEELPPKLNAIPPVVNPKEMIDVPPLPPLPETREAIAKEPGENSTR